MDKNENVGGQNQETAINLYFPINNMKLQVFAGNIKSVLEEESEAGNTTCNTGHTPTPVLYSSQ
jgi:hypothetical protein